MNVAQVARWRTTTGIDTMSKGEAYQEAERRIAAARREAETRLDLSRLGLTVLPKALGQLTQLRQLLVRNNELTTLPEALGQLTQLQYLNVSGNGLTTLPEAWGS